MLLEYISIHAPRVGSDLALWLLVWLPSSFQSTLPVWGATGSNSDFTKSFTISIHAPRVGSDTLRHGRKYCLSDFNPRSPCGERPLVRGLPPESVPVFQSTLPVWGATAEKREYARKRQFQSTLPVWGATTRPGELSGQSLHFNPRSPCGERPLTDIVLTDTDNFNPRSPCGERPVWFWRWW